MNVVATSEGRVQTRALALVSVSMLDQVHGLRENSEGSNLRGTFPSDRLLMERVVLPK